MHSIHTIALKGKEPLVLGRRGLIMGILNVTPDSFSDGGRHAGVDAAVAHARQMLSEGADIIDVGGESTRPGAEPVAVQTELDRVIPVIEAIRADGIEAPLSIDTMKPLVADQAIQAGADIVNDVRGLQGDPHMAQICALHDAPVVAMHWDQNWTAQTEPVAALRAYFTHTREIAAKAGIGADRLILDPGFGFSKTLEQNYSILHQLFEIMDDDTQLPLLVGTSRKSMLGRVTGRSPEDRVHATVATTALGYARGGHIFRVHDVAAARDALLVAEATLYGPPAPGVPA